MRQLLEFVAYTTFEVLSSTVAEKSVTNQKTSPVKESAKYPIVSYVEPKFKDVLYNFAFPLTF